MKYKHRHRELYKGINIDIKAHSSKELHEKVKKKKEQIDSKALVSSISIRNFGMKYLDTYKNDISAEWKNDLNSILNNKIAAYFGEKPIGNIKQIEVQAFVNSLSGLSESRVKKIFSFTKQIFRHAYNNGLTETDFTERLTRPNGYKPTHGRSLTDHEREVLLDVLSGHRGEVFCKLMLYCGLRPSEIQALQWKDIDLKEMIIHVTKSRKKDNTIGETKTPSSVRDIPIPFHLKSLLSDKKQEPFKFVIPYSYYWRNAMWNSVKREMNIRMGCKIYRNKLVPPLPLADDFHLYNLRHTYCTDLEKKRVPISIASRLMGHSDISVTAAIYTHSSTEAIEIARELINSK